MCWNIIKEMIGKLVKKIVSHVRFITKVMSHQASVTGPDVTLKVRIIHFLAPISTLNWSDKYSTWHWKFQMLLAGFNIHLYTPLAAYVSPKIRDD